MAAQKETMKKTETTNLLPIFIVNPFYFLTFSFWFWFILQRLDGLGFVKILGIYNDEDTHISFEHCFKM